MKTLLASITLVIAYFSFFFLSASNDRMQSPLVERASIGDDDDVDARTKYEFLIQRDPVTNSIPRDIHRLEQKLAKRIPTLEQAALAKGAAVQELVWTERGPTNVGGRTRVLAADVANVGTLLAGSVAGGIWKTTNDGASWRLTFSPSQIHTTSCIAQDVRPGKTHIWYVGTGEFRGSTTNDTRWGSFYRGDGIYRSTNNGDSWTVLPSTFSGTPQSTDPFDFIWNVATNPANPSQDEVYAATWNGIHRSTNGGNSWTQVQSSDSGLVNTAGFTTDVGVTSTGVVYAATKSSGSPVIWRSPDGVTWTNIVPSGVNFPTSTGRIVLGLAPSNVNVVYVFIESANTTPASSGHQLWKYTYISGNGSGTGGTWENRGGNLPSGFSTQTGYDQIVHVKPDDENFVLVGGTDLYRSTNGFATSGNTTNIGGYNFYPNGNHHPDLQSGTFKPSDPTVYYSGNDGGVQRANDIRVTPMVWTSLDNGYNVTQFYSLAISSDSGDNAIAAGAQDNGSWVTEQPGMSAWNMLTGGDGTVSEIGSVADDRVYTQSQSGPLYRQARSGVSATSMRPSNSTRQLFVNPIALDPNDSRILYYGAGKTSTPTMWSGLWRNDNAPSGTTSAGWTAITATDVGSVTGWTRATSTIGISTANAPNVVYFGTTDGIIKRVDSATSASPVVTDVTPPGLNGGTAQGGFVRCVAVDPTNSNKALAAFGNYNFQNLWYTTNGGATWIDVEGNLSGPDGPSIRWATIFYIEGQLNVFLATSIGVLMTNALDGPSTVWTQAAENDIGNILIAYLDYRASDRTLAVGTHSRGAFTTQIPAGPTTVTGSEYKPERFALAQNYPNPFNPSTTISFDLPQSADVQLRVFDLLGRQVALLINERKNAGHYSTSFSGSGLASGVYLYTLVARSTDGNGVRNYVETKKLLLLK